MRIVAAITDTTSIKKYLDGVGLSFEVPEIKPARPPPQLDFDRDLEIKTIPYRKGG